MSCEVIELGDCSIEELTEVTASFDRMTRAKLLLQSYLGDESDEDQSVCIADALQDLFVVPRDEAERDRFWQGVDEADLQSFSGLSFDQQIASLYQTALRFEVFRRKASKVLAALQGAHSKRFRS
jgi:hypothetical protein